MIQKIKGIGLVPVVSIDSIDDAIPLAKALEAGGLPCAEITFRTDAAQESIRAIKKDIPHMVVGAGTVLSVEQIKQARDSGADFVVTPGFSSDVVAYCVEHKIPIIPGVSSASQIEQALRFGIQTVKFFPAEPMGGLAAIKSLSAPYSSVSFMPTGGINRENLNNYLAFDRVIACGGSWMVKPEYIREKQFEKITALTEDAMRKMHGFALRHVGINCDNDTNALCVAKQFERLFGFGIQQHNQSVFAGSGIEVMKQPGPNRYGHIAIGTNSVFRARTFLERQGVCFDDNTAKFNQNGEMTDIYICDEISGFSIHLAAN